MGFSRATDLVDTIDAADINQYDDGWRGLRNDVPMYLLINDTGVPALRVQQQDSTFGYIARFLSSTGALILNVTKDGAVITLAGPAGGASQPPVLIGTTLAEGISVLPARSDHVHALDARVVRDQALGYDVARLNALINGDFRIPQYGTTITSLTTPANNTNTYVLDRWRLLSEANNTVDVAQDTASLPTGAYTSNVVSTEAAAACKLTVVTANNKFGIFQVVESTDSLRFRNVPCSLSFKAKVTGGTINSLRAGILQWDGTADSVSSTPISSWGSAGAGISALTGNWTFVANTQTTFTPSTSWQTFRIENVTASTTVKNIAVMIWSDDKTTTVGDALHVTDVQLNVGIVAPDIARRPYDHELALCQRFYCKSYDILTPPGGLTTNGQSYLYVDVLSNTANRSLHQQVRFPRPMRGVPTVTVYNPGTGSSGSAVMSTGNMTAAAAEVGQSGCHVAATDTGASTTAKLAFHWTASAEL